MNTEKQIAQTILLAQSLREASYDKPEGIYRKEMEQCLIEAGDKNDLSKNLWALLNLAMHWYNDIQLWAEDILANKNIDRNPMPPEVNKLVEKAIKEADNELS